MSATPTGGDWDGFTPPPDGPYVSTPTINDPVSITDLPAEFDIVTDPAEQGYEPLSEGDSVVEVETSVEEPEEPLPEFDPRCREPLIGLMHIGFLERTFDWIGHTFRIRTLTDDEELICGTVIKEWQGTLSEIKAYQTAMAAACIITVDGEPIYKPLGDSGDNTEARIRGALTYIRLNWAPITVDRVFTEYLGLERTVNEVVAAMGKAQG